ncbi:MAG: multiheme c-type cytochrome [bacterium]|nr:multiheme c-type cytochrome [bacterium]
MKSTTVWILLFTIVAALLLVGCEGKEGKQGPAGPAGQNGNNGQSAFTTTYVGDDATTCNSCHATTVASWKTTGHYWAYDSLDAASKAKPYCLQCHTTGYDSPANFADTSIVTRGPDRYGFDDYWPAQTAHDSMRLTALKNVQCEACHGPHNDVVYNRSHTPELSLMTRKVGGEYSSLCVKCHDTQLAEYDSSGHAHPMQVETPEDFYDEFVRATWSTNPVGSLNNCWECHTSEGFIKANDPDWAAMAMPARGNVDGVGCVTCHDPHSNGSGTAQLRNISDEVTTYFNAATNTPQRTFTGYGASQTCVQCHKDRRDSSSVRGQIVNGNTRFGPHGSPQMDMFVGGGAYEIPDSSLPGRTYNRTHVHQTAANASGRKACVMCHMNLTAESPQHHLHNFKPEVAACTGCHGGATSFASIVGSLNAGRNQLDTLAAQLERILTNNGAISLDSLGSPRNGQSTQKSRKAAWALRYYQNDKSHGAHNPAYAKDLLTNALNYLDSTNP